MEWVEQAKALPLNGRKKIMCCGSSTSAIINHMPRGVSKYCFRCSDGKSEFIPHTHRSVEAIAAAWAPLQGLPEPTPLPDDCLWLEHTDTPSAARVWLLRAGIPLAHADAAGYRYSPGLDRVVFPVYTKGEYCGFVGRSLSKYDMPKYRATVTGAIPAQFWGRHDIDVVVVVEDQLSAMKVARSGYNAAAVFGTTTRREDLPEFAEFGVVISWFDNDAGGQKGHRDLRKKLRLTECKVLRLVTPKDPKNYDNLTIREMIRSTLQRKDDG